MFKNLSKKIVAGLMIALMVIGVFLAISNFIAGNVYAKPDAYFGTWLDDYCYRFIILMPTCFVAHLS